MIKYIFVAVSLILFSCNAVDRGVRNAVGRAMDGASAKMLEENIQLKKDLILLHQKVLQTSSDTAFKSKADLLLVKLNITDHLIDSLQGIINEYKEDELKGVEVIRKLIGEGPLGDRLYHSLTNTIEQAKLITVNSVQRSEIDTISVNMFQKPFPEQSWQGGLFGAIHPTGASWLLFGIQKELYRVCELAYVPPHLKAPKP